jgi:hypothetical protein
MNQMRKLNKPVGGHNDPPTSVIRHNVTGCDHQLSVPALILQLIIGSYASRYHTSLSAPENATFKGVLWKEIRSFLGIS